MFEGKKILVLGMARSGYEVAKFLIKHHNTVLLNDGGPKEKQDLSHVEELESLGVTLLFNEHPDDLLDDSFDYLIKNPGIAIDHKYVLKARELGVEVLNEAEMAYRLLPDDVTLIGITGSNGKTTTTTLTYLMIKQAGLPVHLAGNIGVPLCHFLDELQSGDIIVMEVSCQQLENMSQFKPDIALMTNLYPAHLDFLKSYDNYKRVKLKLFANQTDADVAILNIDNEDVMNGTKDILAKTKYFSSKQEINGAYYCEDALWYYNEKIIDRNKFLLAGNHNIENALAAIMIAKEVGVDNNSIVEVLSTFTGVEHRLEFCGCVDGVSYYNDTEATNTRCTQIALSSFQENVILILGGLERGQDFHDLDDYLSPVLQIVAIGQCRHRVKDYALERNVPVEVFEHLKDAFSYIAANAKENDVVLLSPASASWDQYRQCEDRGDEFKKYVKELENKEEKNED